MSSSHAAVRLNGSNPDLPLPNSPDPVYENLTQLAAQICQTPTALINWIEGDRHQFQALSGPIPFAPGQKSCFCPHTLEQGGFLIVEDVLADDRFAHQVGTSSPHQIRFYAGVALLSLEGQFLGTLCVLDWACRRLSLEQQMALRTLGQQVVAQLELRRQRTVLHQLTQQHQQTEQKLQEERTLVCKLLDTTDGLLRNFVSTVLDTTNALVVILTPSGRILRINELCQQTIRCPRETASNFFFWELLIAPESVERAKAALEDLKAGQHPNHFESQCLIRTGERRTIAWSNTLLFRVDGSISYLVCSGIDVTDRQRIEAALRESESQYRSVVEGVKEVIFKTNTMGQLTFLNPAWVTVTGFTQGESIGILLTDYIHPLDCSHYLLHFQSLTRFEESVFQTEIRWLHQDGSYHWLELWAQPILEAGNVISIFGTLTDISQRKQAEAELREKEDRCRAITANVPGMLYQFLLRVDQTVTIPFVSAGCCDLFELGPEEIQRNARRISDLIHPEDWSGCEASILESAKHLRPWKWEGRITTPSGQSKWVRGESRPAVQINGDILWNGLFTDITARKQSEALVAERSHLSTLAAEIGVILGHSSTLSEMLEHSAAAMHSHLNAAAVRIWILDAETNLLELQAIAGPLSHCGAFPSRVAVGISIIGFIAQTQQPYLSNDAANDICIGAKSWLQQEQIRSFIGYPLVVENRLIGVMVLFSQNPSSDATQTMLRWMGNSLAIAVDRTWAREELLSRREALLLRMGNQIRLSLDLDTILETTVTEIRSLLNIDRCHFLWCSPHPEHPQLTITHESCHPSLPSFLGDPPPDQVQLLADLILNLEMIRIDDVLDDPDPDPEIVHLLTQIGDRSQLLLPLATNSGQFGAIVCSHNQGARPWLNSEVDLLRAVTDQLAIAMDQAELYAQTRAAALAAQTQAQQLTETLHQLQQTQAQLVQNEKMSSLGQMVAGVAHEINNPVNFISGNTVHAINYIQDLLQLLRLYQELYPEPEPTIQAAAAAIDLDFLAEDAVQLLHSIQMGAERIRQIVLSLRNFSRLDEAEMKPVDIHEGIDSTLLLLQHRLKATTAKPAVEIIKAYGDLPRVECYAGQLNQVFMNILGNGLDALEEAGVAQPTLRIQTQVTAAQRIQISITDNGPGIPDAIRSRLFDPFFTTKPVGKGTGLGLSISYQIVVDQHRGTLRCESESGQGSTFWIEIPVNPLQRSASHLPILATPSLGGGG